MRDRAVGAVSRADVAEDHEGGGAVLPALADVRAVRLLADRVQVQVAHEALQAEVVASAGRLHLEPGRLPLRQRFVTMAPQDLVQGLAHAPSGAKGLPHRAFRRAEWNVAAVASGIQM